MAHEVIHGPEGDVFVPAELELLDADGFMLRRQEGGPILLEILGPSDDSGRCLVIARLAFAGNDFERFVSGLATVTESADRQA
jgi:hypothetical protein